MMRATPWAVPLLIAGCVGSGTPTPPRSVSDPAASEPASDVRAPATARRPLRPGAYDLGEAPVFSRSLYFVREDYIDRARFRPLNALLGSLDFVQRDTPEVMVEHRYRADEPWVTVRVGDQTRRYPVAGVDAPWSLRRTLTQILGFVQDYLPPVAPEDEARRLLQIEIAATTGMLYTLDPHSVLIDPESYRAMRAPGSRGPKGVVGLVYGRGRDDEVVVQRALEGSPAALAGVQVDDRIISVDGIPTSGMNLQDVFDHLHGDVGTPVELQLRRPGLLATRKVIVTRALFSTGSATSAHRLLQVPAAAGRPQRTIGYFRLERFAFDADVAVRNALSAFEREGVTGIILDLRGNQGGLYEQAVRVSDAFLRNGMMVSMVGVGGQHKDEFASSDGHEPQVPVAILVDHDSAAASEIVASALKELDRGVVIGEQTAGAGSVQVLFDIDAPAVPGRPLDGSSRDVLGLKLTTAQWITPSRASIQGVGVGPDIELLPRRADPAGKGPIRFERPRRKSETDYEWRLPPLGRPADLQPELTVPYLEAPRFDAAAGDEDAAAGSQTDRSVDGAGRDFAIEFARDMLAQAKSPSRRQLLAGLKPSIAAAQAEEDGRVASAMLERGLDWRPGARTSRNTSLEIALDLDRDDPVPAGESLVIRAVVKNVGIVPVHRVRAVVQSESPIFSGAELAFGAVEPGAMSVAEATLKVPKGTPSMADLISLRVVADERVTANAVRRVVTVQGMPRPVFTLSYETMEDAKGPGIVATIRNIGPGIAPAMTASLRNVPGHESHLIDIGRCPARRLAPADVATCTFRYRSRASEGDQQGPYTFELAMGDAVFKQEATHRIAFQGHGQGAAAGHVAPPLVTASAPLAVDAPTVHLTGEASDDGGLRDVFITVQNLSRKRLPQKVFYLASPGHQARVAFSAEVPLSAGSNYISVNARGADGIATTTSLMVLRASR